MQIKWFGHGSFELKIENKTIYINPYKGEPEEYKDLADIILISRWHFSDCSLALVKRIKQENTAIIAEREARTFTGGVLAEPNKTWDFGEVRITPIDSYTINTPDPRPKGTGYGFLIETKDTSIYYADDTSFIPEMTKVKADIVILPVGGTFVMNPKEAAKAAEVINPKLAIPSHYGSLMGSNDDAEWFKDLLEAKNIKVIILEIGKDYEF
ncbi:MBL fold metallo-hydrolase [Candidatus Woesearchaeota archaeon]|nr:MBL fold metallo-hydrolase [Candidatus Woesearchaeota archaeon]MBW2994506.1 MBL fold metallo-hydrolase [Candidatus Woesearchaeota archaeon]